MPTQPNPPPQPPPGQPVLDERLLKMLVCPKTHQALVLLGQQDLAQLNQRIFQGALKNSQGDVIKTPVDAALHCQASNCVYPVRDGIPVMLIEEAIAWP